VSFLRSWYRGQFHVDFLGRQRIGLLISTAVVVVSLASLLLQGVVLGIDFEGGTVWQLPSGGASVAEVRDALRPVGQDAARIQLLGGDSLRVQAGALADDEAVQRVTDALAQVAGVPASEVSVSEVGPSWGENITAKAVRALVVFFVAVALYISLRFEWRMAIAALVAVVHDVIGSVGVYSVLRIEVTPATVIAFLTILGYSLYDTIVVFDKVQEMDRGRRGGAYGEVVNASLNEVLTRSINTTLTSLLPVASLLVVGSLIFGATTLQEFAIALLVGLLLGAYSSVFVAAPVLARLKGSGPQRPSAAERRVLTPSGGRSRPAAASPGPAAEDVREELTSTARRATSPARTAPARPAVTPRARKKRRRR
jgi:preprotein translocase subunit SecF